MNQLQNATSPYLQQHAENPVHWWPWCEEALNIARDLQKPILLSIGYSACHWCHVMAHESFEDQATADLMNALYINIKVDREERPDIDHIYMNALQVLGEQGGWPLTMFLTPEAEPIWGGTYFPKTPTFGRPSFMTVLQQIADLFEKSPERIAHNQKTIKEHLHHNQQLAPVENASEVITGEDLDTIARQIIQHMDIQSGGLKGAPKFPQATLLESLMRYQARQSQTGNDDTTSPSTTDHHTGQEQDPVITTLTALCQGGIYDHVGGGFARYAVDEHWHIPHFEKMLCDNAHILNLLTAHLAKDPSGLFRNRIEQTISWLTETMRHPEGGFFAALDADSEGIEGRYYIWSGTELQSLLNPEDYALLANIFALTPHGNWPEEQSNVFTRLHDAGHYPHPHEAHITALLQYLQSIRQNRVSPGCDTKIMTDWNGYLIRALAHASAALNRPDWLALAEGAFDFIAESNRAFGRLRHISISQTDSRPSEGRNPANKSSDPVFLSDYAAMIEAALALYTYTRTSAYRMQAEAWAEQAATLFADAEGRFYLSRQNEAGLFMRPAPLYDDANPNPVSLMARAYTHLHYLTGKQPYKLQANRLIDYQTAGLAKNIIGSASLQICLDDHLCQETAILVLADNEAHPETWLQALKPWQHQNRILIWVEPEQIAPMNPANYTASDSFSRQNSDVPMAHDPLSPTYGKQTINGHTTLYLCKGQTCSAPITELDQLADMS